MQLNIIFSTFLIPKFNTTDYHSPHLQPSKCQNSQVIFQKKKKITWLQLLHCFAFFSSIVSIPTHRLHNFTTDKLTFTMKGNEIPRKSIFFPFQMKLGFKIFKFHYLMLREINVRISYYILTYCTVTTILRFFDK